MPGAGPRVEWAQHFRRHIQRRRLVNGDGDETDATSDCLISNQRANQAENRRSLTDNHTTILLDIL